MEKQGHFGCRGPVRVSLHAVVGAGGMTNFPDRLLEEEIAQWRAYVGRRRGLHGPSVEELEMHLRGHLAALTGAGLAGDEAFLIAVKRLGVVDALSREFARVHSERLWKQLVIVSGAANEPASAGAARFGSP